MSWRVERVELAGSSRESLLMFRAARGARRRLSACEGEVRRGHDGAELHSGRRGDDTVSFLD